MDNISTLVLTFALFVIMFGMGLSLGVSDFKRVLTAPKAVILGLINQIILLPLVAFALIWVFDIKTEIAVGIMLLAACPGGVTSNIITHLAKGDSALSVTLTGVSSLITIFSIPFIVKLALETFLDSGQRVDVNALQMIGQLLVIVIIPVFLGMLIRMKRSDFANRMDKPVRIASTLLLVLVTAALIIKERANIPPYFKEAGVASICLNVCTLLLGFATAMAFKLKRAQAISISVESGIQNSALAITIATITLQNTQFAIAPAIYTLIMYASGFLIIYLGNRAESRKAQ